MKKIRNLLLSAISLLMILQSCNVDNTGLLPAVTGRSYELVVVIPDHYWKGKSGDLLKKHLMQDMDALPNSEPIFDVAHINRGAFGNIFRTTRNLLMIEVDKNIEKPKLSIQKDVWAKTQVVIRIIVKDEKSLYKVFEENAELITQRFIKAELDRAMTYNRKNEIRQIRKDLIEKHNLSLIVPGGYRVESDSTDFQWILKELGVNYMGVCVYHYPYLDTTDFSQTELLNQRDAFMRKHIHGSRKNTYMQTEHDFPISYNKYIKDSIYTVEMKGLWHLQNDFMGGAFLSIASLDQKRNRIVVVEGWLYAPNQKKRTYMRQIESVVRSYKIIDK